jgi:CubicO group peptidase (beta-lactamase class C family)
MKTARFIVTIIVMTISAKAAAGLTADTVARIDSLFASFDHPNAPGASVMVIHDGKPVFAKGYGLANLDSKTPCTTNTNFRLASVTKQFTAMAVMILAEQKQLSLGESLTAFFPEFPDYGKAITVRHLLTHTSGLIDYEDVGSGCLAPFDEAGQNIFSAGDAVSLQQFGLCADGFDCGSAFRANLRKIPQGEYL